MKKVSSFADAVLPSQSAQETLLATWSKFCEWITVLTTEFTSVGLGC